MEVRRIGSTVASDISTGRPCCEQKKVRCNAFERSFVGS